MTSAGHSVYRMEDAQGSRHQMGLTGSEFVRGKRVTLSLGGGPLFVVPRAGDLALRRVSSTMRVARYPRGHL